MMMKEILEDENDGDYNLLKVATALEECFSLLPGQAIKGCVNNCTQDRVCK